MRGVPSARPLDMQNGFDHFFRPRLYVQITLLIVFVFSVRCLCRAVGCAAAAMVECAKAHLRRGVVKPFRAVRALSTLTAPRVDSAYDGSVSAERDRGMGRRGSASHWLAHCVPSRRPPCAPRAQCAMCSGP